MKYIDEINAFNDWLETNPIPTPSIALWYGLMAICNKTGWKKEFNAANSVLEIKTGLSKQAIHRARNTLKQSGLIDFKVRQGQQSTVYLLIPFAVLRGTQTDTVTDTVTDTIPRLDKTRLDKTRQPKENKQKKPPKKSECGDGCSLSEISKLYLENGFGQVSGVMVEMLSNAVSEYGTEWCKQAFRIAVKNNARSWKYVETILVRWAGKFDKTAKPWELENGKRKTGNRADESQFTDWSNMPTDKW